MNPERERPEPWIPPSAEGSVNPLERRLGDRLRSSDSDAPRAVRLRGLVKVALGAPVAFLLFLIAYRWEPLGELTPFVVSGFPGLLAWVGLAELVSGTPIQRTAAAWDRLAGWQRLLLGTLAAAAAFGLALGFLALRMALQH